MKRMLLSLLLFAAPLHADELVDLNEISYPKEFYENELTEMCQFSADLSSKVDDLNGQLTFAQQRHDRDTYEKIVLVIFTAAITILVTSMFRTNQSIKISFPTE